MADAIETFKHQKTDTTRIENASEAMKRAFGSQQDAEDKYRPR